eukprot:s60_g51.t1
MEPATFVAEIRQQLGIPDSASDTWCPKCDAVLDAYSHHAGERALRHSAIRDVVHTWIDRAGLNPEKERPGLLLPRRPEDVHVTRRHPADIFVPCLEGTPTALDFAVTGPQRTESLSQAMHKPVSAAAAYADLKATRQDTGRLCSEQGINSQPMVVETTGAWDKTASHVLHIVAAAVAARERATVADLHNRLLQELSITTRRFRAQATLRRRAEIITQTQPTARASAATRSYAPPAYVEAEEGHDRSGIFHVGSSSQAKEPKEPGVVAQDGQAGSGKYNILCLSTNLS